MRKSLPLSPSPLTRTYGLGYPLLFHWLALVVFAGFLLFAAVNHIVPLLLFTIFLLIVAGIAWFWSRKALDGLACQINLNQDRAFPGETAELILGISNGKWLPLSWLEMEIEIPYRLVNGRAFSSAYTRERPRWTTSLQGGQKISWKHAIKCQARGEYQLGPARLRTGDILGLFPREMLLPQFASLLVYPRIVPVDKLNLPMRELTGERGIPRSIYEDATRLMGARDYQPDDPLKSIHWKASAHQDHLQTKIYESSTSQSFLFILDVYGFCASGNEEDFELAITTVASLAHEAHQERCSTGLIANSVPEIRIPVASGHRQFMSVLEALARVQLRSETTLHEMMERDGIALPMGVTPVVVASLSPVLMSLLNRLERSGHSPVAVNIGVSKLSPLPSGVPVISVRSLGDLSRRYSEAK